MKRPPVPGKQPLVLALDIDTQRIVEQALIDGIEHTRTLFDESQDPPAYLKANSGAVIVMDPATGGVKALASWPTFDPSWFVQGPSRKQLETLYGDRSGSPMLDRATQLSFAPGSTFKPFIALAAEQHGIANFGSYYPCPPEYVYPGDTTTVFHNWTTANLGTISVETALTVSCDTVFYQWGADFYEPVQRRPARPRRHSAPGQPCSSGSAAPAGLDLPVETPASSPTPPGRRSSASSSPRVLLPDEAGLAAG